ncbi:MAG: hypothetical protein HY908_11555 [Myxococcales bacterium]|nr:hypothetical protein [Myxococcales bacterium]
MSTLGQALGALALALAVSVGGGGVTAGCAADEGDMASDASDRPVAIGADGYFYLDGVKSIVFGAEEEHHHYTPEELDALVPRLHELGVGFLVLYVQNPQEDFFYERLEAAGLYVAQDLGNVKKRLLSPFAATGGVIGTVPDAALVAANLAQIDELVGRLARFRSILFWWMGGELVEPAFHSASGSAAVRASVHRYAERVRALDPLGRPFTVSHHYLEALADPLLSFVDFGDDTDFTWLTVATHFHLGDFSDLLPVPWLPVARATEPRLVLTPILERAFALNRERPVFFGGWYGQAPLLGPCRPEGQAEGMVEKWAALAGVPHSGGSTYHLSSWGDNDIPHALFVQSGGDWLPTEAGLALGEIIASAAP